MKSLFIVTLLFAMNSFASSPCEREISNANGSKISRTEQAVYSSIHAVPGSSAKKDFWMNKSLLMKLITFQREERHPGYGAKELIIMNPQTCKVVDRLTISSYNENE